MNYAFNVFACVGKNVKLNNTSGLPERFIKHRYFVFMET